MKYLLLLLFTSCAWADQYTDAFNSARDAAYIQSGLQDNVNKAGKYGIQKAKETAMKTGLTEKQVKIIAAVGAESWQIYKKQQISIPVSNNSIITLTKWQLNWELHW